MNAATAAMYAQRSASKLLQSIWGERGFPVDPVWIAGELGVTVIEAVGHGRERGVTSGFAGGDSLQRCRQERSVEEGRDEHTVGEFSGQFEDLRAAAGEVDRDGGASEPQPRVLEGQCFARIGERFIARP